MRIILSIQQSLQYSLQIKHIYALVQRGSYLYCWSYWWSLIPAESRQWQGQKFKPYQLFMSFWLWDTFQTYFNDCCCNWATVPYFENWIWVFKGTLFWYVCMLIVSTVCNADLFKSVFKKIWQDWMFVINITQMLNFFFQDKTWNLKTKEELTLNYRVYLKYVFHPFLNSFDCIF